MSKHNRFIKIFSSIKCMKSPQKMNCASFIMRRRNCSPLQIEEVLVGGKAILFSQNHRIEEKSVVSSMYETKIYIDELNFNNHQIKMCFTYFRNQSKRVQLCFITVFLLSWLYTSEELTKNKTEGKKHFFIDNGLIILILICLIKLAKKDFLRLKKATRVPSCPANSG